MYIVTKVFNAITNEALAEEGKMFLRRCGKGITLRMLNIGLEKNNGWHPVPDGSNNIDIKNAVLE